jgi:hypothetical protein
MKLGKETACPPQRFPDRHSLSSKALLAKGDAFDDGGWQRRVKLLAIFDHLTNASLPSEVYPPKRLWRRRMLLTGLPSEVYPPKRLWRRRMLLTGLPSEVYPPKRLWRRRMLLTKEGPTQSNLVKPSQTWSNQIQPPPPYSHSHSYSHSPPYGPL